jgi:hypothetical protein
MAVVLRQLWTGMLLDRLRFTSTWAAGMRDESSFVGNDVIHLTLIGADPSVLIDNTVYPIVTAAREDNDAVVALRKYETTNTSISDDELYAVPIDKPGSVIAQHRTVLEQGIMNHGLYTIAPLQETASTPVLVTTGYNPKDPSTPFTAEALAGGTHRLRLVPEDIIKLKRMMDDLKIPKKGRKLVLSSEHVEDLLMTSQVFKDQYHNIADGKILPLYGFEMHEDLNSPVYNISTKVRKAFGASSLSTDATGSVAFFDGRCFSAMGTTKMYYSAAEQDPTMRRSVVGFRQWGIIMPYNRDSQAAIISGRI